MLPFNALRMRKPVAAGGGFPLSGFTQLNVGANRYITESPGAYIRIGDTNTSTAALQLHGICKAAPASPYRVVVPVHYNGTYSTFNLYAFGFRNSSSGALRILGNDGTGGGWEYAQWNSATSRAFASVIGGAHSNDAFSGTSYLGITNTGSNLLWEWSANGTSGWVTYRNDAVVTMDQVFVGVMPYSTGLAFSLDVYGWTEGSYP